MGLSPVWHIVLTQGVELIIKETLNEQEFTLHNSEIGEKLQLRETNIATPFILVSALAKWNLERMYNGA